MRDLQKKRYRRRGTEEEGRKKSDRRRGTEEEGQYPGRGVRVQQVFGLLVVDLQKHDAH